MNCSDRTVSAWQHGRVFLSTCQQNSPSDHDAGVCASTEDNILFFFSATLFPLAFIPLGILTCLFPSEFHTPSSPLLYLIWLHRPSSNACLGYPLGRFNYLTSFLALHVCSCSLLHFFCPTACTFSPLRAFVVSDLLCCMPTESRSLSCWRKVVRARHWQNCRYSQSPCSKLLATSKIPFCASYVVILKIVHLS